MLGAKIGEFTVTQKNEKGNVNIEAITDVKVNLIFIFVYVKMFGGLYLGTVKFNIVHTF